MNSNHNSRLGRNDILGETLVRNMSDTIPSKDPDTCTVESITPSKGLNSPNERHETARHHFALGTLPHGGSETGPQDT